MVVDDVTTDPRYIPCVADVRSELVIPLMHNDRCIGVFDLASPDLAAFSKRDVEILTPLANHTAVAIENARLYEAVAPTRRGSKRNCGSRNACRSRCCRRSCRSGSRAPTSRRGSSRRASSAATSTTSSRLSRTGSSSPSATFGKGAPAALYSAFAGELVRGRTFRRRYTSIRSTPAGVLTSMNNILHQRQLEEYLCTLCYASFDFKRRSVTSRTPACRIRFAALPRATAQIELPGVPLGSFAGSTYDEVTFALAAGDIYVICSDGIFEAMNEEGEEFTASRAPSRSSSDRGRCRRARSSTPFSSGAAFRGSAAPNDDMTVVALRILN